MSPRKYQNASLVVFTTELKGWQFIIYLITFNTAMKPHKKLYYIQLFWTSGSVSSDNADKANVNFGSYLPVYTLMDRASEKLLIHNFPTHILHKTVKCAIDKCHLIVKVMKPTFSQFVWQKFLNHRKAFILSSLNTWKFWGLTLEHSYWQTVQLKA